jgi:hypothetical protein
MHYVCICGQNLRVYKLFPICLSCLWIMSRNIHEMSILSMDKPVCMHVCMFSCMYLLFARGAYTHSYAQHVCLSNAWTRDKPICVCECMCVPAWCVYEGYYCIYSHFCAYIREPACIHKYTVILCLNTWCLQLGTFIYMCMYVFVQARTYMHVWSPLHKPWYAYV